MKKFYLQTASLIMTAALVAVFGFLTYFIVAKPNGNDLETTVPLPDQDSQAPDENNSNDTTDQPDTIFPEQNGQAPDILPDADIEEEEEEKKRGSEYIRSKVNGLSVRSGPGTSYALLGSLDKNDMVTYKGQSGNWYITEYKHKTAYVSAGTAYTETYFIEHDIDETIEKVISEGFALLGHPYVYGATRLHDGKGNFLKNFDKTKFDCSSLTQYMYYHGAGVKLDVTTRTQVKQGVSVSKSDLKRGDLMFFTNSSRYYNSGIERIGHVAVYLGDNYILHTSEDHAVIEPISAQRWKYYIESRRVA